MKSSLRGVRSMVALSFLACMFAACGGDEKVVATHITSVLEGTVRNGLTRMPIEGATVRIVGADGVDGVIEATTDADGHYRTSFTGSGRFTYVVEAEDFARVVSTITFDPNDLAVEGSNASYIVTQLVNQDLYPRTGTLRARVYGSQFRDWVADAPVTLTFFNAIDDPTLTLTGTTDEDGTLEIGELPAGTSFTLTVRATDRDGDGVLDTAGSALNVTLEAGITTEVFVGPLGPYNGAGILWTNLDDMRSWPVNPELVFIFRSAMDSDASATIVTLRDSNFSALIATEIAWSADGTELTITPAQDLVAGRDYYISFSAWSRNAEAVNSNSYNFRIEGGSDERPTVTGLEWLDDPTEQDMFDTSFELAVDAVDGADSFRFYGRNPARASGWVHIGDRSPNASFPKLTLTLNVNGTAAALLASFPNDTVTFFGRGEALEVAASIVIAGVEGPLSAPIQIRDEKCVDVALTTGTNDEPNDYFDNTDGDADKPVRIRLQAGATNNGVLDYLSEDSAATITIANAPFSTDDFVLDPAAMEETRVDRSTIDLTGTLAIDEDAQLDLITVDLETLSDPSGNPVCQEVIEAYTPGRRGSEGVLPQTWDFESGPGGWTGTGAFVRGNTEGATSPSTLWATGLGDFRADDTTSVLRSPRFWVPSPMFFMWNERRDLDANDAIQLAFITDDGPRVVPLSISGSILPSGFARYSATIPGGLWGYLQYTYEAGVPAGGLGTTSSSGFRFDDVSLAGIWPRDEQYDGN